MTQNKSMNKNTRQRGRPKQEVTLDKKQEIRCTENDKALWKLAAENHESVSDWAREVLTRTAKRAIKKNGSVKD
ncbi:TPA: hypothetical protein P7K80_001892 [Vibrio cholerae]|uniref:hypothetical protein n=1 Tax=Vibrio cholerae TaxID=666 RepID=UPI0005B47EE9|nr:hypothetical protein [Vibrio cholerae]EGQ9333620.1 hypothetical protein [Vibrio cholerae]EGR3963688.1 hypothetical protein [Vibrio cholerae]MCD6704297.1 hypothetical protein [Vibrio cholerae]MEE3775419.1 hypothetical protein [Vibrio cholerae]MVE45259.1 hypothetical protein [Vibrio cholerae]